MIHAQTVFHKLIGFANQLHIAVFDAVVHHFDKMSGAVFAHPVATGFAGRRFGGDGLQNRFYMRPGFFIAAGHNRRSVTRAFFTAGNAGSYKTDAFLAQIPGAPFGIGIIGIAAIDNDVAGIQKRQQLIDKVINRFAGAHHQQDFARMIEHRHQFFQAVGSLNGASFGSGGEKFLCFGRGAVVSGNLKTLVVHIQNQILPHYRQADYAYIRFHFATFQIF